MAISTLLENGPTWNPCWELPASSTQAASWIQPRTWSMALPEPEPTSAHGL